MTRDCSSWPTSAIRARVHQDLREHGQARRAQPVHHAYRRRPVRLSRRRSRGRFHRAVAVLVSFHSLFNFAVVHSRSWLVEQKHRGRDRHADFQRPPPGIAEHPAVAHDGARLRPTRTISHSARSQTSVSRSIKVRNALFVAERTAQSCCEPRRTASVVSGRAGAEAEGDGPIKRRGRPAVKVIIEFVGFFLH